MPMRTVTGSSQVLDLYDGAAGGLAVWTQDATCGGLGAEAGGVGTATETEIYAVEAAVYYFTLHTTAGAGVWTLCYKPDGGAWTVLTGHELTIIALPTFTPEEGVAGMVTPVSFLGQVVVGDVIMMKPNALCVGASVTPTGASALAATPLAVGGVASTSVSMTAAGPLTVCYATLESGGESDSDFSPLAVQFEQESAVTFSPLRTVAGAAQTLAVVGGEEGDQVAWILSGGDCGSLTPAATSTQTAIFTVTVTGGVDGSMPTSAVAGSWMLCMRPNNGIWTGVTSGILTVISPPTFAPISGVAGMVTTVGFSGDVATGDLVVMVDEVDCSGAPGTTTGSTSLAPTPLSGDGEISTTTLMTGDAILTVCFATVESSGNGAGDYVALAATFEQLPVPTFTPIRTVLGAEQELELLNGRVGDLAVWTNELDCENAGSELDTVRTVAYPVVVGTTIATFHPFACAGTWRLCYLPVNGVWTEVTGTTLEIIPTPTYQPLIGVGGEYTIVGFEGALEGDVVVMQVAPDCSGAFNSIDTASTTAPMALTADVDLTLLPIHTEVTEWQVCFSTSESGSNDDGDFVKIGQFCILDAVDYSPKRSTAGAAQVIRTTGLLEYDMVAWTQEPTCDNIDTPASPTKTQVYLVPASFEVVLPVGLSPGDYTTCVRVRREEFHWDYGSWTILNNRDMTLIPVPIFAPTSGLVGLVTPITFSGDVVQYDYVVMTSEVTCANAHTVVTGPSALSRKPLTAGLRVYTSTLMTNALTLTVCFATKQSAGNEEGDFVVVSPGFTQLGLATFTPTRTVEGVAQHVSVSSVASGDEIAWTLGGSCVAADLDADADKLIYTMGTDPSDVILPATAAAGVYTTCYRPSGGLWTEMVGASLTIMSRPSFTPLIGLAGMVTPVSFTGGAVSDVVDGDWVVMKENGCGGASTQAHAASGLAPTQLATSLVHTTSTMTSATLLSVCFATLESGGNSDDDYTDLLEVFQQQSVVSFDPVRTLSGAAQELDVVGGQADDQVAWTLGGDCGSLDPVSGPTQTEVFTLTGVAPSDVVVLNEDAGPGTWTMCYLPLGGSWTEVVGGDLVVEARPGFFPRAGVINAVTSVEFDGAAVNGDVVVMLPVTGGGASGCEGAASLAHSSNSLAATSLAGLTVDTLTSMADAAILTVCYATTESLGDSDDDFVALDFTFEQVVEPVYSPSRTFSGAQQELAVSSLRLSDEVAWTTATSCSAIVGGATPAKTGAFQATGVSVVATLHSSAAAGTWILCFKPHLGAWTHVVGSDLTVESLPQLQLFVGVAGMETYPVSISGGLGGDWIVMQEGGCVGASTATLGVSTLPRTALYAGAVATDVAMTAQAVLSVCVASGESTGDSDDDYVEVAGGAFYQVLAPTYTPVRTVTGASQTMVVEGGLVGDAVAWTRASDCSSIDGVITSDETDIFDLTSGPTSSHVLHDDMTPDQEWQLCFRPTQGGLWTLITQAELVVEARPGFAPLSGVAGMVTELMIDPPAVDNDWVVLIEGGSCVGAATVGTTGNSLESQLILGGSVFTSTAMTLASDLSVCFATAESQGDEDGDFTLLPQLYSQYVAPGFLPIRVVSGASQEITLTGGNSLDEVAWTLDGDCEALSPTPTPTQTAAYVLSGSPDVVTLNSDEVEGEWRMCYRTALGVWTEVTGVTLTVVAPPSFSPVEGVSGHVTDLVFENAGESDKIVMVAAGGGGCGTAHLVGTGADSLVRTGIDEGVVSTSTLMIDTVELTLCYATLESGGDSGDDYVALAASFYQLSVPTTDNSRTVEGASQSIKVGGGGSGDRVAWTQDDDCDGFIGGGAPSPTQSQVHNLIDGDVTHTTLSSSLEDGDWLLCFLPEHGVWTPIPSVPLVIIPRPTFTPLVGVAGMVTTLPFTGGLDGDFVVMRPSGGGSPCSGASGSLTTVSTLGVTPVLGSQVSTEVTMTSVLELTVCYASLESGGDSDDDYVALDDTFEQVAAPSFSPLRTVSGAVQQLLVVGGGSSSPGSQVAWTMAAGCDATAGGSTAEKTVEYGVGANPTTPVVLHAGAGDGDWGLCFKPGGGVWTRVTGVVLTVIAKPTFTPVMGVSGSVTPITFTGSEDGDMVVLKPTGCTDAHLTPTGATTLSRVAIDDDIVSTTVEMVDVALLRVCYATAESGGDSNDDYVALTSLFTQVTSPTYTPTRVAAGAAQLVEVVGFEGGDEVAWTRDGDCGALTGVPGASQTAIYAMTAVVTEFTLHDSTEAGSWTMCYKIGGSSGGVWTLVEGMQMTVVPRPTYTPPVGVAGMLTTLLFSGDMVDSDLVVLQAGGCVDAHLAATGPAALAPTVLVGSAVSTVAAMTSSGPLAVCYAPWETAGDEAGDFTTLTLPFEQLSAVTFSPTRVYTGTAQNLVVSGGDAGDTFAWIKDGGGGTAGCSGLAGVAGDTDTEIYSVSVGGGVDTTVTLHAGATAGVWSLCYKPSAGVWTSVTSGDLVVDPLPVFDPVEGVAGMVTPIVFTGTQEGDFVVLKEGGCDGASFVQTGVSSLIATGVNADSEVLTSTAMVVDTQLTICIASWESQGDSDDDYVALPVVFTQLPPPDFGPDVTVEGAEQSVVVGPVDEGAQFYWTTDGAGCTPTPSPEGSTQIFTVPAGVEGEDFEVTLAGTEAAGDYILCYLPESGVWTEVTGVSLVIGELPSFTPLAGVAGMVTPVSLIGGANGDFVVMMVGGCVGAAAVVTSTTSLGATVVVGGEVDTTAEMTTATPLSVCYASQASGGDSDDDYTLLLDVFTQVPIVDFAQTRVVSGAGQVIDLEQCGDGDQLAWSAGPGCDSLSETGGSTQTDIFTLDTCPTTVTLDTDMVSDTWTMCYRPADGDWTEVLGRDLTVEALPTFFPFSGLAGAVTPVYFVMDSLVEGGDGDGDFVVMKEGGCGGAAATATDHDSVGPSPLFVSTVYVTEVTTVTASLTVCYATAESGGDSDDDYVALSEPFVLVGDPVYTPRRTVSGAAQVLAVTDVSEGDEVAWTTALDCDDLTGVASAVETVAYVVPAGAGGAAPAEFPLHVGAGAGVWTMCFKPVDGVWTVVDEGELTVAAHPSFDPVSGIAGSVTPLTFTGSSLPGDYVVLTPGGCGVAPGVVTSTTALGSTQLSVGGVVSTVVGMTVSPVTLTVCFATVESLGESADDYVEIGVFQQLDVPTFGPDRTVSGAKQDIVVSFGSPGDELSWTLGGDCTSLGSTPPPSVDSTQSDIFEIGAGDTTTVTLHPEAEAGEWTMCYRAEGGVWQEIPGQTLTVVARPTIYPVTGIAGMITPITFTGSVVDGDLVVLQTFDCVGASLADTDEVDVLGVTAVSGSRVLTTSTMTSPSLLVACYATVESGGDSDDDFSKLDMSFNQVEAVEFSPNRAVAGSEQELEVTGGVDGDSVVWSLEGVCSSENEHPFVEV